ncbi:MAG: Na(+)/H(+) antiporter subunit B [Proteobacteria bacterium]|nr:Na(+)/H(+) antiporter subunit B [Pseudomonadota bacterium]MDA1323565.1 Na(+)/H(+) antiporter subunit B [Pseudomonadota bacterium]
MRSYLVLRVVAKLLLPFIFLFALYVQFHGDFGPGGGFQAGVIFASGFILYSLIFGLEHADYVLPRGILRFGYSAGVLLFAGVGVYDLFLGGNFLDYSVMAQNPVHGQHWGIFLVELAVGITVASVMVSVFFTFAGHRKKED